MNKVDALRLKPQQKVGIQYANNRPVEPRRYVLAQRIRYLVGSRIRGTWKDIDPAEMPLSSKKAREIAVAASEVQVSCDDEKVYGRLELFIAEES